MLPITKYSDILFPMTADLYYPSEEQDSIGQIVNTWQYDRTIPCSAIKERPSSAISNSVTNMKFYDIDYQLDFRTPENISLSEDEKDYMYTDIVITNIQDPQGNYPWTEPSGNPTRFEIEAIEPLFDPFHVVFGYRVRLRRSDDQVSVNV